MSQEQRRKTLSVQKCSLFFVSTDLLSFCDRKINESMMWMWRWDIKWLEVVNQTLIKSVRGRVVHTPWVQTWPDLGDFPDRCVYITRGCNCSLAHFTPLKPSVFLSYFKGTVFLIALMRKLLLFAAPLNMLTCLHPVSSFYVVPSKNPVLFFSCWVFCFCKTRIWIWESSRCFVLFSLLQRFIGQVLFLAFEKADLSRPL